MAIDKETLDYLRDNLEAQVRQNVEARLFRWYIGLAFAFLGGAGIAGVPWLLSYMDSKVDRIVAEAIKTKTQVPTERAKEIADQAQLSAEKAREAVSKATIEITVWQKLLEDALQDMKAKSTITGEQLSGLRGEIEARTRTVDASLKAAQERLLETEDRATQLSDRLRNAVPDAGAVTSAANDVNKLAEQVGRLSADLKVLAERTQAKAIVEQSIASEPQVYTLVETTKNRVDDLKKNLPASIVYLHFAALTRENAKMISAKLSALGWRVPGEERVASAANLRQIRCFYADDCKTAETLKQQTENALGELGYGAVSVSIQPLLDYSPKPRQGIFELWLGLDNPARGS